MTSHGALTLSVEMFHPSMRSLRGSSLLTSQNIWLWGSLLLDSSTFVGTETPLLRHLAL